MLFLLSPLSESEADPLLLPLDPLLPESESELDDPDEPLLPLELELPLSLSLSLSLPLLESDDEDDDGDGLRRRFFSFAASLPSFFSPFDFRFASASRFFVSGLRSAGISSAARKP